jgi:hypothetical protein
MLSSLVTDSTGALNQTINFSVGSGTNAVSGSAIWAVSSAVDFGPRLVGVNIDIFSNANTLVLSDSFAGVLAGSANSTFAGGLDPGSYRMVITGTGVRDSSIDLFLNFGGTAAVPSSPIVSGALKSSETIATPFLAQDTLYLNSMVTGQTGALEKTMEFTLGDGITGFSGLANWTISTADGTAPRLTGVNINLLDANDVLLFSDTFAGVLAGNANSVFTDAALTSGTYKLVVSGSAARDVNLNVALTFAGTRPPGSSSVPAGDPATFVLLGAGLSALGGIRRRCFAGGKTKWASSKVT